jgi:hypothetical protein
MTEKILELKLKKEVEKRGGMAVKFFSAWFTGMPDRIVLMPGGKLWFVEMKAEGANVKKTGRQPLVHRMLESRGFRVRKINSPELLQNFITEINAV